MPTSTGYTGQRADAATGLDYYSARYYDPVVGQFTSADDVLPGDGLDPWGLSRYAYVEGNPISRNDPSGHCPWCIGFVVGAIVGAAIAYGVQVYANYQSGKTGLDAFTSNIDPGLIAMGAVDGAFIGASLGVGIAVAGAAIGEGATVGTAAYLGGSAAATDYFYGSYRAGQIEEGDDNEFAPLTKPASAAGDCGESFSSDTLVTTPTGETPIGHLQVGDPVVAYDPQSKATSAQHVEHVFIDHDTDLLDITLHKDHATKTASTAADSQRGRSSKDTASDEVVHTTASHPWLTTESGWVRAGTLHVGERVVRADGSSAIHAVPGAAGMYDLTVSNVHTFAVGFGRYVVHNCAAPGPGDPQTVIVTTDDGYNVPVPGRFRGRWADNNKGVVFQDDGATGNSNMVRIMQPTAKHPAGYMRYYNDYGQPLDINGSPGPGDATHIDLDRTGAIPGYVRWLQRFN